MYTINVKILPTESFSCVIRCLIILFVVLNGTIDNSSSKRWDSLVVAIHRAWPVASVSAHSG